MKAAEGAGLKAVLVKNVDDIPDKAACFTGVQVHSSESSESSESSDISAHPFLSVKSISSWLSSRLPFFIVMKPRSTCCKLPLEKNPKKDEEEAQEATASLAKAKEISMAAKSVHLDC